MPRSAASRPRPSPITRSSSPNSCPTRPTRPPPPCPRRRGRSGLRPPCVDRSVRLEDRRISGHAERPVDLLAGLADLLEALDIRAGLPSGDPVDPPGQPLPVDVDVPEFV